MFHYVYRLTAKTPVNGKKYHPRYAGKIIKEEGRVIDESNYKEIIEANRRPA